MFRTVLVAFMCFLSLPLFVLAQAPSQGTTTTCTCPSTDDGGYALGTSSSSGGTLECRYPIVSDGQVDDSYYCTYNSSTGALMEDEDLGSCPSAATCTLSRRARYRSENNFTAMKRKQRQAAAQPATSMPDLEERQKLRMRKAFRRQLAREA